MFKIDTGAEVTAISDQTYNELPHRPQLNTPSKTLRGPSSRVLEVAGQFKSNLKHKDNESVQEIYVVKGLKNNLLGLPAITALQVVSRIETITDRKEEIKGQFPSLFQGLGNLGDEYEIVLKPDAKPFALYASRNVPLPLREEVKKELDKMENMGVISKVEEPTPWCAGMVVGPKKDNKVRICVDLKKLNENVMREVHPLPKVDETLAQLSGARVFSKLDCQSHPDYSPPLSPRMGGTALTRCPLVYLAPPNIFNDECPRYSRVSKEYYA